MITDNDGTPTLSIDDVTVPEGTSAVFTVTLSHTSSRQITVRYATSDGTATSPADYTSTNGTLTIAAQTSSVTITVPTVNDTIDESDETFTVTLTSPRNATVSDGQGAGMITDNDGTPTLSIDDVTVPEGTSAVFTVTLSHTSSRQITVRYATSDGTATSPADYTSTNGTLTIAAQTSSVTITVPTVNDTIDESDETFTVTLTSPQNATVSDGQGAGMITDNDGTPTLSIDDVTVPEGTSAVFTVTLSHTSSRQITVRYATSDGTAISPADYTSTNGTLTIAAQTSSVTITVPTVNDTIDESDETFTVTLTSPQNATVSDGQGAGMITDNDGTPHPEHRRRHGTGGNERRVHRNPEPHKLPADHGPVRNFRRHRDFARGLYVHKRNPYHRRANQQRHDHGPHGERHHRRVRRDVHGNSHIPAERHGLRRPGRRNDYRQ